MLLRWFHCVHLYDSRSSIVASTALVSDVVPAATSAQEG